MRERCGGIVESRRYRAFVSYSQIDKAPARKLQTWLEAYRAPKSLGGKKIGAIFRDETHLAGAADLGEALKANIDASDALIVMCSPHAAKSPWVEREIRHFRATGRAGQIFAVILGGEPNSDDAEKECFPPSFRTRGAGADLSVMPIEPLAVNLAADGLDRSLTRLAAGLLAVPFDALWQHQRRRQRLILSLFASAAVVFLCVAAAAVVLAFVAESQRQQATIAMDLALERSLAVNALNTSAGSPDRLTVERSAALALEAQRRTPSPEAWTAASRTLGLLPLAVISRNSEIVAAEPSPDGAGLLVVSQDGEVTLHDPMGVEKHKLTARGAPTAAAWAPAARRFAVGSSGGEVDVFDAAGAIVSRAKVDMDEENVSGGDVRPHNVAVQALRFLSDSVLLAVGADRVALIDASSGRLIRQLVFAGVMTSAFCDDSVALGLATGAVMVVIADQSRLVQRSVHQHSSHVSSISCARAGRRVASVSYTGELHLVSEAGQRSLSIPGWSRLSYFDDGRLLAVWTFQNRSQILSQDGSVIEGNGPPGQDSTQLFDGARGALVWSNHNYTQSDAVGFGGGRFVAIDERMAIRTLSPKTPGVVTSDPISSQVEGVHVSAKGDAVTFGASEGFLSRLDLNTGEVRRLARTSGQPWTLTTSPDGRLVYSIGDASESGSQGYRREVTITRADTVGGELRFERAGGATVDAATGDLLLPVLQVGQTQIVRTRLPSGESTVFATLDGAFDAIAEDPASGRFLLSGDSGVAAADASARELWRDPLGRFADGVPEFAAGGTWAPTLRDFALSIRRADNGKAIPLKVPTFDTTVFKASPDGRFVASTDRDFKLVVTDQQTGEELVRVETNDAYSFVFDPHGRWVAIGLPDDRLTILDLTGAAGERAFKLSAPINRDPIPSADGRFLLLVGESGLRIIDLQSRSLLEERMLHPGFQAEVAVFSTDLSLVAAGGEDRYARVIDRDSGRLVVESRFSAPLTSAIISKDNHWAAFGARDGTVRVFDLASGRLWAEIASGYGSITKLDFAGQEGWVVVEGGRGVSAFRLDPFVELCKRQGRNLTPAEWQAVGGSGSAPVSCTGWR